MATGAIVEEVALNLEEVANVTRRINTVGVGFFAGGLIVGATIGFYFGRRWQREKLRAEAFAESLEEVDRIREVYMAKAIVAEPKPTVDQIIRERGYSTEEADEIVTARPLPAPVPIHDTQQNVQPHVVEELTEPITVGPVLESIWDYPKELESRSPEHPYVIHQNELGETEYDHVAYTYYNGDDVLCDESDTPLPHGDIIVGQENLKWGHGSDDINVVFVRNDKLELDMEICRSYKSYEEEVLGQTNDEQN